MQILARMYGLRNFLFIASNQAALNLSVFVFSQFSKLRKLWPGVQPLNTETTHLKSTSVHVVAGFLIDRHVTLQQLKCHTQSHLSHFLLKKLSIALTNKPDCCNLWPHLWNFLIKSEWMVRGQVHQIITKTITITSNS